MFCNPAGIGKLVLFRFCHYGSGHGLPQPLLPVGKSAPDNVFDRYALFIAQTRFQYARTGQTQPVATMTELVRIGSDKADMSRKRSTAIIDGRPVSMVASEGPAGPNLF